MKRFRNIFTEWVVGLILSAIVILGYLLNWYPLQVLEYKTYDFLATLKTRPVESPVVIVAIDDGSIRNMGRWPWPRRYMADMIDMLSSYGARVIGINVLYTEPVLDPGQAEVRDIISGIEGMSNYMTNEDLMKVYFTLKKAERKLDNDATLSDSISFAENVVLPLYFTIGERMDDFEIEFPAFLDDKHLAVPEGETRHVQATAIATPIPAFAEFAGGLGHTNIEADEDGTVRWEPLLVEYGGRYFPSFALQLALSYLNYSPQDIDLGGALSFGKISVPVDTRKRMLIRFNNEAYSFPYFSFSSVLGEMVPAEEFKDKIVLIGTVSTGIGSYEVIPLQHNYPPVEIVANVIENILNRDFLFRPQWARYVELGVLCVFALFVSFAIPRLKAATSAVVMFVLLASWVGAAVYLFVGMGAWLRPATPIVLLALGYTFSVSRRFIVTEKKKEIIETDSIETNKLLGLSFQGQGLLDMALDKFMKCPVEDPSIKEHLYNLGLDFERKRQFNKSVSVYKHILAAGRFKDIEERIKKLTEVGETMIFGAPTKRKDSTVVMEGGGSMAPTLGRYEVERELGRGAMGTVYLGRDPKINRQVAIKTIRLDEIEEEQIPEIKSRFFREAEAAGKLSHPNIVTIYDAGEEHDLAYVAMELLDGMDLSDYCKKLGKLMPLKSAIRIAGVVADALDYAHRNGVVHRDIKPANIMITKKGVVKVTDFGIARVMESSKTQTGVVLGTPSYMSPEQVVGKKVDGRSDLFSLGVMFYELVSGAKPFTGDSMATLMYNIANVAQQPLGEKVADLPGCVVKIADRMLAKNLDERYQRGQEIVRDLKDCYKTVGG